MSGDDDRVAHFTIDRDGNGQWVEDDDPQEAPGLGTDGKPRSFVNLATNPRLLVVFNRLFAPEHLAKIRAELGGDRADDQRCMLVEDAYAVYQHVGGRWVPLFVTRK